MPNIKEVKFGGLMLKLRLAPRDVFKIENRLDESIFGLFMSNKGGMALPSTKKLLIILQGANQVPNVSDDAIFKAFEQFIDEGNSTMDLMNIVQELLDESGFFGTKDKAEQVNEEAEMNFETEAMDFEA